MAFTIPMHRHFHDDEDKKAVVDVIERGMHWAIGPEIAQFEKELAAYSGCQYALAFNNGTTALHAMLLACGIGPGDEVIVPSFTFIATANAVKFTGATPVFADIEPKTLALDPQEVEKKITKNTKAIMPIHYAGAPAGKIKELAALARKHQLLLLEDAAESLGAELDGVKTGRFGDAAIYSFCANKVITCGEGGAVVTGSKDIYEKLKLLRSHGRAETANYFETTQYMDYVTLGYNMRMPSMVAALALSQLKKIKKVIQMRRAVAQAYGKRLGAISQITLPADGNGLLNVYQLYTVRLPDQAIRDALQKHLEEGGIMSKVYFEPVHFTHYYKSVLKYADQLPQTEAASKTVLSLPMFTAMSDAEVGQVCERIEDYFKKG